MKEFIMGLCKKCGAEVEPGTKFCETCGAPVDDGPAPPSPQPLTGKEPPVAPPATPKSSSIPHLYIIAGIAIVVIILAVILASGVLSINVTTTVKDPIVGVWRNTGSNELDVRFQFSANGSLVGSGYNPADQEIQVMFGTWKTSGNNSYEIRWTDGSTFTVIYDPARNVIYDPDYPGLLYAPYQGDVMTASPTRVSTVATATANTPKYSEGDIAGQVYGDEMGELILDYSRNTDTYSVQTVLFNNNEWVYLTWDPQTYSRAFEEDYDPVVLDHVNPQSVKQWI
jgi:hypothetical protein